MIPGDFGLGGIRVNARALVPLAIFVLTAAACGYRTGVSELGQKEAPEAAPVDAPSAIRAQAGLRDAKGETVGLAEFFEQRQAVRIDLKVLKLAPGKHGIHVHAVGKCDAPDFMTAGGHFNPANKKHGLKSAEGPHAGDLVNLVVGSDGTAQTTFFNVNISLAPGSSLNLLKEGGTAIVIHGDPDDETTDPSGNSGARIACGVITKVTG